MHAPKIPSRIQLRTEATAARTSRRSDTKSIPAKSRKHTAEKQVTRKRCKEAFCAACEYKPSAMPPANTAAIATAGSFMKRASTGQAFRYEMSAGINRRCASRQFHSAHRGRLYRSPFFVCLTKRQDLAPASLGRTTSKQFLLHLAVPARPLPQRQVPHAAGPAPQNT